MIYLFDKNLKLIEVISSEDKNNPILENTQEWELNGLITATARVIYKKSLDDVFYFGQKDDNKNFFIYKVRNTKKENKTITLNGIHIFFDELKGKIVRDIRPNNKTTSQAFTQILENTGWTPVVESSHSASANYYMQSTLSAFTDAIDLWKVEFIPKITMQGSKILKREVIIKDNISKDYGKWFEYGDKLISVVSELNLENIYTAYLGRGKGVELTDDEGNVTGGFSRKIDFSTVEWKKSKGNLLDKPIGQDILEFPELNSLYSYPDGSYRIGIAEFDDIQVPSELLQATYEYAIENSRPKVQLKANAFLIDEIVEIGETVAIVRDDLNIRYKTKVFKIINDFNNGKVQTFEFGDKLVISQAQKTITAKKDQDKKFQEIESKLSQALDQITNYYFNEDGYNYELKVGNEYNLPAGYYSFDRPIDKNPTKVVYMGAGKVLISNEKGTDGAWIWQTAVTGDGIAGSALTTNSITANKLAADVGQGLDLSSNEYIQSIVSNNSDISDEVYQKISELNNLLEDKISESTINELLEEINNQLNVNSTKINQNENKLEIEFNSIKAEVDNNRADLNTLTSTITSGQDDEGNSYTEWGSTGNAKVRVGANGIDIISNDKEVMSFRDGEAYAKALYVTETIGFGNHTAQKYGTEYTIFSWNGGE